MIAACASRMRFAIAFSAAVRFSGPAFATSADAARALAPMASMVPARAALVATRGIWIVMARTYQQR